MSKLTSAVLVVLALAGCTRNASEGQIVLQVLDFRDEQPLGVEANYKNYAPAAATSAAPEPVPATVCLVDADTPAKELASTRGLDDCRLGDADALTQFAREEGGKTALVDVNGDGTTDTITYGLEPGGRDIAAITTVNTRIDGGYLLTTNDKVIYNPGDTIVIRVRGWLPKPEVVHVQIWNNWNGGFHFWSSEAREVSGEVDFEVQTILPTDWPTTNESTGAAYFTYPVSELGVHNGDNFVLLNGGTGTEPAGTAPVGGAIVLAGGADAVSTATVTTTLSAAGASFYRLSNDEAAINTVPWVAMRDAKGTDVPWTLAAGPDGPRTVYAQFADKFGAVSETVSDGIRLDATPIEIRNLQVTPPLASLGAGVSVSFTLSEPAAGGLTVSLGSRQLPATCTAALACTAVATTQGADSEGNVNVRVRAVDQVGWVDVEDATLRLDLTPPDTLFTGTPPSGTVASDSAAFGLASNEAPVTYECRLDGAPFATCPPAAAFGSLAEGAHTFEARAIDQAGNVDPTPASRTWIVDRTGPQTVIDSGPAASVNVGTAVIAFSSPSTDAVRFECRLDGAPFGACVSAANLSGLATGAHSFEVRAFDAVGNVDPTPAIVSWTVDTTPPDTILASAPSGVVAVNAATLQFYSPSADTAAFECSLNGAAFAPCTSPNAATGLADGPQTFAVRAIDAGGNVDASPAAAAWTVDTTAPDTIITAGPPAASNSALATLSFTSGAGDVAGYECRLDGGSYAACTSATVLNGLANGAHTFEVRARDAVGNVDGTPAQHVWSIDTSAPAVTNVTVTPGRGTTGDTIVVDFYVSEAVPVTSVTLGGNAAGYTSLSGLHYFFEYTVTGGEAEGTASAAVSVADAAGNVGSAFSTVVFDFTPPDTVIDTAPPAFTNALTADLAFHASEAPATYECEINGGGFGSCLSPFQETPLVEGPYTFSVRAIDAVGLVDPSPAQAQWTVDYTAPSAPNGAKISVTVKPPLTSDQISGTSDAVEGGATVRVYADATLAILLATFPAAGDGSFTLTNIGDDVGDAAQQVYVTATDTAGNESAATPVRNPRIPPRVTRALISIAVAIDTNGYPGYGNPGDVLQVTWNNSVDGDNNDVVTSASVSIPGLGSANMFTFGGGNYVAVLPLASGTFDGQATAYLTVVGEAGLTTGPVASSNTVQVDVGVPAPPAQVTAATDGGAMIVYWMASPATDVERYRAYRGTSTPDVNFGDATAYDPHWLRTTVDSCTDQYYGVLTVDDAGNESAKRSGGPVSVEIDTPQITAWGAIGGAAAKLLYADTSAITELHFEMVTQAVGAPPWTTAYPIYKTSPASVAIGINPVKPLKPGTDYIMQARSVKNTCQSAFSDPVVVTTLNSSDHQGGVAICPGCGPVGLPGRWYFGGLGFAVAGVGDAWGNDGKEDILTAVPGQTLALLVNADPLEEAAFIFDYYATQDVVGGGPHLASAGDVNNDGKEDFVIGSPASTSTGKILRGEVRVIDGVTRNVLYTVKGTKTGMQLGYAVSSIGDITGADGKSEVIVGGIGCLNFACMDTTATSGIALVIDGNGNVVRTHTGAQVGSFFGVTVHGGVDVTGDGVNDYAVGAPGHIGTSAPAGAVHVFSGASGAEVLTLYGQPDEKFGFAVRLVKANGTAGGAGRVIVGAPRRDGQSGAVYVYDMTGALVFKIDGGLPEASENFGTALVSGGDLSGDGTYEIVVGDPNIPLSSQYGNGRAFIYAVDSGKILFEVSGDSPDGALGYALDYLSDNNGDGVDEVVVGAPGAAVEGIYNAGKLYILSIKGD